jgi:hypothetical protein
MPFIRPIPNAKAQNRIKSGIAIWAQAEKMMQIALVLPSAAFIGWLAGAWVDMHLHTKWIGPFGIVFGGISGLVYVVRLAVATGKNPGFDEEPGNGAKKGNADEEQ